MERSDTDRPPDGCGLLSARNGSSSSGCGELASWLGPDANNNVSNSGGVAVAEARASYGEPDTFFFSDLKEYINSAYTNLSSAEYDVYRNLSYYGNVSCIDGTAGDGLGGGNYTGDCVPVDKVVKNWWALILIVVPCLTIFGNVLVILAVKRERTLQNVTNYFIVSLAIADLLVAMVVMPFAVYVLVNKNRHIIKSECTCASGEGEHCKHIAALIHFINTDNGDSKTSYEQVWSKVSFKEYAAEKYSKGAYFSEMYVPKDTKEIPAYHFILDDLDKSSPMYRYLLETEKDIEEKTLRRLQNEEAEKSRLEIMNDNCDACVDYLMLVKQELMIYDYLIFHAIAHDLKIFYKSDIVVNKKNIFRICKETLCQSQSSQWFAERKKRLSASKNIHSIITRKSKNIEKLVSELIYPVSTATPAMKYGVANEKIALAEYKKKYNVEVIHLGVLVCEAQPWLCGSVDGIVLEKGCCIDRIVEIKCPATCKEKSIINEDERKCNLPYLFFDSNGNIELRKSSVYFTQCQILMYITGLTVCDLYLYSPIKSILISVHREEIFIKNAVIKSCTFYFKYFLPAYYKNVSATCSTMCSKYSKLSKL